MNAAEPAPRPRIQPATPELCDLADAMRPGEGWRDKIVGFVDEARSRAAVAREAGHPSRWTWARACVAVVQALCDPDSNPRDLDELMRDPLGRTVQPRRPSVRQPRRSSAPARTSEGTQ